MSFAPRYYQLAADGVLIVHALFVVFVVGGFLAIVAGLACHKGWARNPWLRGLHLGAIAIVVLQSWLGWLCPLTVWESALRERGAEPGYDGSFVAYWLHRLIFYEADAWVFTTLYTAFGLGVVLVWLLAPPRVARGTETAHGN